MPKKPYVIEFQKKGKEEIGFLTIASFTDDLPFEIKRIFWTYGTPPSISRGRHAHFETEMILIAINGEISVQCINEEGEESTHILNNPNQGLLIPKLCWHEMHYSSNAVQLVLSSTLYEESDYIRSFDQFEEITSS